MENPVLSMISLFPAFGVQLLTSFSGAFLIFLFYLVLKVIFRPVGLIVFFNTIILFVMLL